MPGRRPLFWGLVPLGLTVLTAAGCTVGPITAWQESLETFVAHQGNGDPNVLRSMDRSPSESDYGVIGKREGVYIISPRRTDAHGELIGHERFNERNWFIFLVGIVQYTGRAFVGFPMDDPRVTDIRLVAFSGADGKSHWLVSPPDVEARLAYAQPQIDLWQRSHERRRRAEEAPTVFPTPRDHLRLTVDPDAVSVVDEHSGARWSLAIPASTGP